MAIAKEGGCQSVCVCERQKAWSCVCVLMRMCVRMWVCADAFRKGARIRWTCVCVNVCVCLLECVSK